MLIGYTILRLILFIPDPDIKRFIAMSVDSCQGAIDGVEGLAPIDGLLNLPAGFFVIK